jgi:hypothetical protein
MIFVIAEDGMVDVVDDPATLCGRFEGIDVENGVFAFYAEDGEWLQPRFVVPNKRGWFGSVSSGAYVLDAGAERPAQVDAFDVALAEAAGIQPNPHFATLEAVRTHVLARRAAR